MPDSKPYLKIHPEDNVWVALQTLASGFVIQNGTDEFSLQEEIPAKHKFTGTDLQPGDVVKMYGLIVGTALAHLPKGSKLTTTNITHTTTKVSERKPAPTWIPPDISPWKDRFFYGYHRKDGSVGTANYWLVFPLVFCENKNIEVIKDAVSEALGQQPQKKYRDFARMELSRLLQSHSSENPEIEEESEVLTTPFPNINGVAFITHQMGCGGTRQDATALCGLLAGYLTNPNVAGATILSLGCQNAQFDILKAEIDKRDAIFDKPMLYFDQQTEGSEDKLIRKAIRATLEGVKEANKWARLPASLDKLVIGLECGGSDGFSGISANPVLGYVSDILVALGGAAVLAEFPELCGVEQDLSNRCVNDEVSDRFLHLMASYEKAAVAAGSGFDMNPSPGNIRDGLITDAMKSAGAAKKGGTSPVVDVLDYPQKVVKKGLNLLNTPGNDVESTTALGGAGCNLILFTTGLGTPTGNPVVPVVKVSSNTALAQRMSDIIDVNTGPVITGEKDIPTMAAELMEYMIQVASGERQTRSMVNKQNDFIPWKRGVSL